VTSSPSVPSAERREEFAQLWKEQIGYDLVDASYVDSKWWKFLAALDAQSAARIEKLTADAEAVGAEVLRLEKANADLQGSLDAALEVVRSTQAMAKEIEDRARAEVESMGTVAFQAQEMAKEILAGADARARAEVEAMRDAAKEVCVDFAAEHRAAIENKDGPLWRHRVAARDGEELARRIAVLPIKGDKA